MIDTKVIAIDRDNTLVDPETYAPIAGGLQAVEYMRELGFVPYVFTANPRLDLIKQWCTMNGFGDIEVSNTKHHSLMYIDDRAVPFTGDWTDILHNLEKSL